jgi:hypothetical protein
LIPVHRRHAPLAVILALLFLLAGLPERAPAAGQQSRVFLPLVMGPPSPISYWGMNLYLTKVERRSAGDNLPLLADLAAQAGVQWTREELVWSLIEPDDGAFKPIYDSSLSLADSKGFNIIGMLLTTPEWARDPACRPARESYWCPPADVRTFAQFAAWMVERYDGDGFQDAPGSPRIAAWEIWNEPNDTGNWPEIGTDPNARKRRYGEMLVAANQAIKAADSTALVLIGGTNI